MCCVVCLKAEGRLCIRIPSMYRTFSWSSWFSIWKCEQIEGNERKREKDCIYVFSLLLLRTEKGKLGSESVFSIMCTTCIPVQQAFSFSKPLDYGWANEYNNNVLRLVTYSAWIVLLGLVYMHICAYMKNTSSLYWRIRSLPHVVVVVVHWGESVSSV